jgi:hypothetical protein
MGTAASSLEGTVGVALALDEALGEVAAAEPPRLRQAGPPRRMTANETAAALRSANLILDEVWTVATL